jgi:histidyl-tRNA synthetase
VSEAEEAFSPQSPRGTHDVLPPASARWERLLAAFAELAERHGFDLVHTPIFEDARVFRRGIGEASEVVGKEMYEFDDRGGRRLALRPEGTASIVRAFVQHHPPTPWRVWYATPAFRYEQAQAGRYRQHHQVGVEVLGTEDPDLDVEVIVLAADFIAALGLRNVTLRINSLGDAECRPVYLNALREYLAQRATELCDEHAPVWERNPLRVLDCKRDACLKATTDAPRLADYLCEACTVHMARVLAGLDVAHVSWVRDERLVRGLDYYTRTTFEFTHGGLGAQSAVLGGGRYDGLSESLEGPKAPGIGFAIGEDRLVLALQSQGEMPAEKAQAYIAPLGAGMNRHALKLARELRCAGISADLGDETFRLKKSFESAEKAGAKFIVIVGENEVAAEKFAVKDLASGEQVQVPRAGLAAHLRN